MRRKIMYWGATGLVAIATLSAAFTYLTTAPGAVETSGLPALPALKEWAYAGFTFMWIAAVVAHYLAGDGALSLLPTAG